jgi:hypothetical protein
VVLSILENTTKENLQLAAGALERETRQIGEERLPAQHRPNATFKRRRRYIFGPWRGAGEVEAQFFQRRLTVPAGICLFFSTI